MKLLVAVLLVGICFFDMRVGGGLITHLPGLDSPVNFKQYSGYINVDESKNMRLFYWFVESQSNVTTDPLVLWLNGGPGCSSMAGFFKELGPFHSKPNKKLGINEYSWNKVANMVFLDSPAEVGFSKTDTPIEYDDEITAHYSMKFLIKFFQMYPHLKSLDFWMTGESYAGHYIPQLAIKVLEHNQGATGDDVINLKGLMIGNPVTVPSIQYGAAVETMYDHHLISIGTYKGLRENCNYIFPDVLHENGKRSNDPAACNMYHEQASNEMGLINAYDIYVDVCTAGRSFSGSNGIALLKAFTRANPEMATYAKAMAQRHTLSAPYDPCLGIYLNEYLNDEAVQKAIFVEPTKWSDCNDEVGAKWSLSDQAMSIVPFYTSKLFHNNLKILIYSGDVDSVVPTAATRYWLHNLHLNITHPWHPWMDSRGQVGGYSSSTKEVTFATVRDAGHQVPTYQPLRAYDMFTRFLKGNL